MEVQETALGKDHPETLDTISKIGEHYHSICEYDKALPYLSRARDGMDGEDRAYYDRMIIVGGELVNGGVVE